MKSYWIFLLAGWVVCKASFYNAKHQHIRVWGKDVVAHRTLRPGTRLEIVNLKNGRKVTAIVCGWGPAKWTGRDLDLSRHSFQAIELPSRGVARVKYRVLPKQTKEKTNGKH